MAEPSTNRKMTAIVQGTRSDSVRCLAVRTLTRVNIQKLNMSSIRPKIASGMSMLTTATASAKSLSSLLVMTAVLVVVGVVVVEERGLTGCGGGCGGAVGFGVLMACGITRGVTIFSLTAFLAVNAGG